MFGHKHYVPILKGKRAEFSAVGKLKTHDLITPLFEAVPSHPAVHVPVGLAGKDGWPRTHAYFMDLVFFDEQESGKGSPQKAGKGHPVTTCFEEVRTRKQNAIPVTGTERSPAYQDAVRQVVERDQRGVAVRLVPDDFDDEGELSQALHTLASLFNVEEDSIDLVIDLGTVAQLNPKVVGQVHQANLQLTPSIGAWRTLTVVSGAFPTALADLRRNEWNLAPRVDWKAWHSLVTSKNKPTRLPSYGDYTVAHPHLPPTGRATTLAQLRYSTPDDFMIWKGENAVKKGFDQFFGICQRAVATKEYRGQDFSDGDRAIQEKATTGGLPGNAETWRRIATNHHIETVLDQFSNLP